MIARVVGCVVIGVVTGAVAFGITKTIRNKKATELKATKVKEELKNRAQHTERKPRADMHAQTYDEMFEEAVIRFRDATDAFNASVNALKEKENNTNDMDDIDPIEA